MPKIAIVFLVLSSATTATQSCKAFTKAAWFWTVWSAGVMTRMGSRSSAPLSKACIAAKLSAGAVLRPMGSSNRVAFTPFNSRNWSKAKKRCSSFVTIKVGAKSICALPMVLIRVIACWNKLWLEPSSESTKNCFGKPDRDKGQRRVPEPPQRMTGVTNADLVLLLMN